MSDERRFSEALEYHAHPRPGKLQISPTKSTATAHDLSLAYSPGVAEPCVEIAREPDLAFRYTNRANLVAVVSNGSAVLGLGNIGALAGKPVMEGKAVLFKRFADIDVYDIELEASDPADVIRACEMLEPTFGGINLEDIKAPECFVIEETLKERLDIPVFHDDQHGTAIIAGAGLINACELTDRSLEDLTLVINGAGAAGIACAKFVISLGVKQENVILCDSKGVVHDGRDDLNEYKRAYAVTTDRRTLADAMRGADVFFGVSVKDVVDEDMVKSMAPKPIVFALANPDPEIPYDRAKAAVPDAIVATGRSDTPNQVNNVLGFPFLFRGALDVHATGITDRMKVAAAHALADLAKQPVPASVLRAYETDALEFGPDLIIPKPFDPRVLWHVAPAVAQAATEEGVARVPLENVEEYAEELRARFEVTFGVMHNVRVRAQQEPKQVVFPTGDDVRTLRACARLIDEGIARPLMIGDEEEVRTAIREMNLDLEGLQVRDPRTDPEREVIAEELFGLRQRRGMTLIDAREELDDPNLFASMLVQRGDAAALVGGLTNYFPETIRPALQTIALEEGRTVVSSTYVVILGGRTWFLADCAVNLDPTAEQLAEIALASASLARDMDTVPRVAMVSHSNFGSVRSAEAAKVRRAVEICHEREPDLELDGEMHADTAVVRSLMRERHPFSRLSDTANVLVFPNLTAANAAYKLLYRVGGGELIGPILSGFSRSVHVLPRDAEVGDIVNLAAYAVLEAQRKKGPVVAR